MDNRNGRICLCIDLKSFYASVECEERGLDPLGTNLVVADVTRSENTICLAVSPSLKALGVPGRPRLREVQEKVRELNDRRRRKAPGGIFTGKSCDAAELARDPSLEIDYIAATPRMSFYIEYSTNIYDIYLRYIAPEDIHVYSVDEVFIDLTRYLKLYGCTAHELAMRMIRDVLANTGITATAGIGTNLYLAKIAMDIVAKHLPADSDGVRIAELDEMSYRRELWTHRPLTDFWRVGPGIARRLEANGMYTMGDVARCSAGRADEAYNEDLLYKLFGKNAELLIDHAWGWEPCTIEEVKAYRPASNSLGSGQVLMRPYSFSDARLVLHEMVDQLALDLVDKGLMTDQIVLSVGFDSKSLNDPNVRSKYRGRVKKDQYGRIAIAHAHGTQNIGRFTSSSKLLSDAALGLYDRIVDRLLLVRRIGVTATHVIDESAAERRQAEVHRHEQLSLFTDYDERDRKEREEEEDLEREHSVQEALLSIKKKYGKNAIVKGMDLEECATGRERNDQIGGHKA